jgi:hypothetical protein
LQRAELRDTRVMLIGEENGVIWSLHNIFLLAADDYQMGE